MKGDPKVIALLQQAVSSEAQAEHQYIADAEWLDRIGLGDLAKFIRARANQEQEHFADFSRRLIFFGTDPIAAPPATVAWANITDMLVHQLAQESGAVTLYTEACRVCLAQSDFVTFDIFREILADEQDHVRYIEGGQYLLGQMGEPNFLQAYVRVPEVG